MVTLSNEDKYEARRAISQAAVTAICLEDTSFKPSAIADVLERYDQGLVTLNDLPAYLKQVKEDGSKAHWFRGGAGNKPGSETDLEHRAFVLGNVSAQAQYAQQHGEEALKETAERYSNPASRGVYGKPGTPLASTEAENEASAKNPFSAHASNIDARGRYTAAAIQKQANLVRAIGEEKAAAIAMAVGAKLGDIGPRRKTRVA